MFSSKLIIAPFVGFMAFLGIVAYAFFKDSVFIDQLLTCAFIISLIFVVKILGRIR